jgi:hypothetical protein
MSKGSWAGHTKERQRRRFVPLAGFSWPATSWVIAAQADRFVSGQVGRRRVGRLTARSLGGGRGARQMDGRNSGRLYVGGRQVGGRRGDRCVGGAADGAWAAQRSVRGAAIGAWAARPPLRTDALAAGVPTGFAAVLHGTCLRGDLCRMEAVS